VRVVGSGVGNISESDLGLADVVGAKVYGFSVELPVALKKNATRTGVDVKIYNVIYELLDDIKAEMSKLLDPEIIEEEIGRLLVKGVFRVTKGQLVCGGEVTKGKVVAGVLAKISREGEELSEAEVVSVQKGQQETKEVIKGEMCGIELKTPNKVNLKEGDRVDLFTREYKARKIE
jgi:translation initiation factor IF-2